MELYSEYRFREAEAAWSSSSSAQFDIKKPNNSTTSTSSSSNRATVVGSLSNVGVEESIDAKLQVTSYMFNSVLGFKCRLELSYNGSSNWALSGGALTKERLQTRQDLEIDHATLPSSEPPPTPSTLSQLHREVEVRLADVGADVLAMYLPTLLSMRGVVGLAMAYGAHCSADTTFGKALFPILPGTSSYHGTRSPKRSFRLKMDARIERPGLKGRALEEKPMEVSSGSPSSVASPISGHGDPILDPILLAVRSPSLTQGDSSDAGVKVTLPPIAGSYGVRHGIPSMGGKEMSRDKAESEDRAEEIEPSEQSDLGIRGEPEEEEEVIGHEEGAIDLIKSSVTTSQLIAARREYNIPLDVTLRVPEEGEVPSQPRAGETLKHALGF
ncbi:hypothetical protein FNV43_RR19659 [Rhamnella rubrinervis]|uniref:Uncharacterized protein n=1 Tax=Rhamnella rubrinervis TaxID=2594499 RepID=A0A8K0DY94_9ROSA|nr:hypothetical protein FNV43_RR19659 [Rhamnella rubrinervis]